jgi:NAD-dependent deacetylase
MIPSQSNGLTLQEAARLLQNARLAVALTGAGFSTPSGIPDFRSKGTGLWERDDPMQVASLTAFRHHPDRFYAWLHGLSTSIWKAQPNSAHYALSELETAGVIKAVITQNIDGLHQQAGSSNVYELHGSMRTMTCPNCHQTMETEPFLQPFVESGVLPRCPACQGLLKPDIVLFEELLPSATWNKAESYCLSCDLILVSGSSLEVTPASHLPFQAVEHGARLIINNRTPTYLDPYADVILRDDIAQVIPSLASLIL